MIVQRIICARWVIVATNQLYARNSKKKPSVREDSEVIAEELKKVSLEDILKVYTSLGGCDASPYACI